MACPILTSYKAGVSFCLLLMKKLEMFRDADRENGTTEISLLMLATEKLLNSVSMSL
jgi:hypothetical protein